MRPPRPESRSNLALATAQNTVGAGTDTLSNFENLAGSMFNDTLTGDGNANVIEGGAGNDTLNGGAGIDTAEPRRSGGGSDRQLGPCHRSNTVGAGTDALSNFENLVGSAFNDTLTGSVGNNVLSGLGGDDKLDGAQATTPSTAGPEPTLRAMDRQPP